MNATPINNDEVERKKLLRRSVFLQFTHLDMVQYGSPDGEAGELKRRSGDNGGGAWCFYAVREPCKRTLSFCPASSKSDSWRSNQT